MMKARRASGISGGNFTPLHEAQIMPKSLPDDFVYSVIASNAKQSIKRDSKGVDCHEAITSRNDGKTESVLHASLESKADSEPTPAVGQCPTAIKSYSGDKRSVSPTLKASSGASGISASDCKGEGATSQFKPLPLNKKENTESNEVLESQKVKVKDTEAADFKVG